MKYIRKNKDGMLTESVDKASFSSAHEAMGEWELVSDEECEAACMKNAEILEAKRIKATKAKVAPKTKATYGTHPARRAAMKAEEDKALKAEFEAFKAWKALQN